MIKVWFDGSCTPNPGGVIGYGALIMRHEEIIYTLSKCLFISKENSTNNVAEYAGAIAAMRYLIHHNYQHEEIYFFGDSKLVINQLSGMWDINNSEGKYVKYTMQAEELKNQFTNIKFEWIPRELNHKADGLARLGGFNAV